MRLTPEQKEIKELKVALKRLVTAIQVAVSAIDDEMKKPVSNERGKCIGRIVTALEFEKDCVRRFTLNER